MPVFSGRFNWGRGIVWTVGFLDDSVTAEAPTREELQKQLHICNALVDTGASRTCIAQSVAEGLGIDPVGKGRMHTAGGSTAVNMYQVRFAFVSPEGRVAPDGTVPTRVILFPSVIDVSEFDPGGNDYQALVGRDLLRIGLFTMSPDQHFSFGF